jgi:hypothetical protein
VRRRRGSSFPLEVFFWTRLGIWLASILAYLTLQARYAQPLNQLGGGGNAQEHDVGWSIDLWARWDSDWFLRIVRNGYADPHHTAAFFPAYPLLVRALGWFLLGHHLLAGVLVSLIASAVAFVLFWQLGEKLLDESSQRRSLLYLALFPTTLFLLAVYSESLYLLASVAAFLAAERGQWLRAGLWAGLGALTRSAGFVLLPALAVLAWRSPHRGRAFAGLAAALPLAAAWPAYLWAHFGHPLLFMTAERDGWNRRFATAGPFGGAWDGLVAGWHSLLQLLSSHDYFPGVEDQMQAAGINLESLAAAILIAVLGVVAWRRLGAAYGVFVLGSLAVALSSPAATYPLLSMPRFALGVFPIFLALGSVVRRPRLELGVLVAFSVLLGVEIARWVVWEWVS